MLDDAGTVPSGMVGPKRATSGVREETDVKCFTLPAEARGGGLRCDSRCDAEGQRE